MGVELLGGVLLRGLGLTLSPLKVCLVKARKLQCPPKTGMTHLGRCLEPPCWAEG